MEMKDQDQYKWHYIDALIKSINVVNQDFTKTPEGMRGIVNKFTPNYQPYRKAVEMKMATVKTDPGH